MISPTGGDAYIPLKHRRLMLVWLAMASVWVLVSRAKFMRDYGSYTAELMERVLVPLGLYLVWVLRPKYLFLRTRLSVSIRSRTHHSGHTQWRTLLDKVIRV